MLHDHDHDHDQSRNPAFLIDQIAEGPTGPRVDDPGAIPVPIDDEDAIPIEVDCDPTGKIEQEYKEWLGEQMTVEMDEVALAALAILSVKDEKELQRMEGQMEETARSTSRRQR